MVQFRISRSDWNRYNKVISRFLPQNEEFLREIPKPIVPTRYVMSSMKTALADCAKSESINDSSPNHTDTEQSPADI